MVWEVRELCTFGCDQAKNACREKESPYITGALIAVFIAVAAAVAVSIFIIKRRGKPKQATVL
jgi:hypothetical protein